MGQISRIKDDYLKYLSKCNPATKEQVLAFYEDYDINKHTHSATNLRNLTRGELDEVAYLDLSYQQLIRIPRKIKNLQNLRALNISYNRIRDFSFLRYLPNLEVLMAEGNQLPAIPDQVFDLPSLTTLILSTNLITQVPEDIARLASLTWLDLYDNHLGRLPSEMALLRNLVYLGLTQNKIDALPHGIGDLKHLTALDLADNLLTALPVDAYRLESIRELDLCKNQFTDMPVEIAGMTTLTYLNLSENQITALRPEIRLLKELQYLDVERNQLESLPLELVELQNINYLYYHDNPFDKMPELREISEAGIMFYLNKKIADRHDYFTLQVERGLLRPIAQYIGFFKEYVLLSKKKNIHFEVKETGNGLMIITDKKEGVQSRILSEYFEEFMDYARQSIEEWSIQTVEGVKPVDKAILKLKLENEVGRLYNALHIARLENKQLTDEIDYLREIHESLASVSLPALVKGKPRVTPDEYETFLKQNFSLDQTA